MDPLYEHKEFLSLEYSRTGYVRFWLSENPGSKDHDLMELLSVWRIMKYDDVDNPDTLKALAEEF